MHRNPLRLAATLLAVAVLPACQNKPDSAPEGSYMGVQGGVASTSNGGGNREPSSHAPAPSYPKGWNENVSITPRDSYPDVTYRSGSRARAYVALTFDDGPHVTNTPRLLDILADRNVKATFYVVTPRVQSHPEIMQRIVAEGHEVGNHSTTHRLMTKLGDSTVFTDFKQCHDAIVGTTGVTPRTQRPPYGAMKAGQKNMLHEQFGYSTILWDVDPRDWKDRNAGVVSSRVLSGTQNGSIILLHDIHSSSVDAVPRILDGLLSQGYTFVTVSQLLAMSGE